MRFLRYACIAASLVLHTGLWFAWQRSRSAASPSSPSPTTVADVLLVEPPMPPQPLAASLAPATPANEKVALDQVTAWTPPAPQPPAPESALLPDKVESVPTATPAAAPATAPTATQPQPEGPATATGPVEPITAPNPTPVTQSEPEHPAPPPAATSPWHTASPPLGLRLPAAVRTGTPAADLVIDPRDASFRQRAQALGMTFILFQDGVLTFFLELTGDDLRTATRRTAIDAERFSRRARDLVGVAAFDRLRDDVANRYGLEPARCRLAAVVPHAVDSLFRASELAALTSMGKSPNDVRALCGSLTGNLDEPLSVQRALLADGTWLEISR